MSLHDSKFFQPPLNDGNRNFGREQPPRDFPVAPFTAAGIETITEVVDNNYDTSHPGTDRVTETQVLISVAIDETGDGRGVAQEFDHVFVKGKGITSYSVATLPIDYPLALL